jgi:hypothetical protein
VRYAPNGKYIKGANRVIYATHIAYAVIEETETHITLAVDLASTDMFILDRQEFLDFLATVNGVKVNASRGTANIQTCYNYKKGAYHGRLGHRIEEWAQENELDDEIIGLIWDALT